MSPVSHTRLTKRARNDEDNKTTNEEQWRVVSVDHNSPHSASPILRVTRYPIPNSAISAPQVKLTSSTSEHDGIGATGNQPLSFRCGSRPQRGVRRTAMSYHGETTSSSARSLGPPSSETEPLLPKSQPHSITGAPVEDVENGS
jgi:hypothetical protein